MMLNFKASGQCFIQKRDKASLADFVGAAGAWQLRHGYKNSWRWPELLSALKQLDSPAITIALAPELKARTPFLRIAKSLALTETETPRLLQAMKACTEAR
jgi:hypothetical protein